MVYENGQNVARLENNFKYHPPTGDQQERYVLLRNAALELALMANRLTPASREQSEAFTCLENFSMWANAAIARNE